MQINFDEYYNRFQNLLDVQADTQQDFILARFSRRELIELRNIMAQCKEIQEKQSDD